MATQTRTPTGFTAVAGANPASTGTQLAAVQTAGDGIYVSVVNNGNAFCFKQFGYEVFVRLNHLASFCLLADQSSA